MSIIIENKEDIELLIEFFKLFNTSSIEAQEDDDLRDRVNQIDKWKLEQANAKKNFAKELLKLNNKILHLENAIEELTTEKNQLPEKKLKKQNEVQYVPHTLRKYSTHYLKLLPKVKSLTEDGHFILGKNRKSVYTIEDVLQLKTMINSTSLNFKQMGEKVGISEYTAITVCLGIEKGIFEKFFHEWEQMKADEFYGNWKPNNIVNNPQKRKENGMV